LIDKKRQRATKRRLKRARHNRRFGGIYFWAAVAVIPLAIAVFYLNHYVFSKTETDITVADTRSYRVNNDTRFEVRDESGKLYHVQGFNRGREYAALRRGQTYRCKVRGIDQELPLWWDFHAEITDCGPALVDR
jgi:hypothetical protein